MKNELDFVGKVKLFNAISGNNEEFTPRKASMYVGLIFEELAEMVDSFGIPKDGDTDVRWNMVSSYLDEMGTAFKSGQYDYVMNTVNRRDFLDASVDIAVVSLGAGISIGADIDGACNAVADNNLEKFEIVDDKYVVLKDENGKVKKPLSYKPVQLDKFIR